MNIRIYLFLLMICPSGFTISLSGQTIEALFQKADSLSAQSFTHLSDSIYWNLMDERDLAKDPAISFRAWLGISKNRLDYFQFKLFNQYMRQAKPYLSKPSALEKKDIGYYYFLLGCAQQYQGQLEEVTKNLSKAEEIWASMPEEWPSLVKLYLFRAQTQVRKNNISLQKTYLDKAFAVLLSKDAKLELLGDANVQLARFYRQQGNWAAYLDHARQAEENYRTFFGNLHPKVAIAIQLQSQYYDQRGDLNRMLQRLEKTQTILDQLYPEHVARLGQNAGLLSNCYRRLQRYELAHQYIDLSIDRLTTHLQTDQLPIISDMYRRKGLIYEAQDSLFQAIEYYEKSLFDIKGVPQNVRDYSRNHQGLTRCFLASGDLVKATYHNQLDFELLTSNFGPDYNMLAETYRLSGAIRIKEGQLRKGIAQLQLGLEKSAPSFKALRWTDLPVAAQFEYIPPVLSILKTKAQALQTLATQEDQLFHLKASFETYQLAIELIDQLRSTYQAEEARQLIQEDGADIYRQATGVMIALSQLEPDKNWNDSLFAIMNKGKALLLEEAAIDRNARQFAGIPDSLLEKEQELRSAISTLRYDNQRQLSPIAAQQKQRELIFLEEELNRHIEKTKLNFPKYYELKYDDRELKIAQLEAGLLSDQAIIQYFFTPQHLVLTLVQSSGTELLYLPIPDRLEQKIEQFLRALRDIDFIQKEKEKADQWLAENSYVLYKDLLAPVMSKLSPTISRLVLIPDGQLTYLPFEQLIDANITPTLPYQHWPWLMKKYSISYASSSKMWWQRFTSGFPPQKRVNIAAFAPAYESEELVDLPYAVQEVNQILKTFRGKSWLGVEATEAQFKAVAGDYEVYHLAMHGLINDEEPMRSYLAFQQKDPLQADEQNDNYLSIAELYALDLEANLVVLSACNTGVGQLHQSEGMMSLARGFAYGGANSIVMSMWSVGDQSTASLMTSFYKKLKKGKRKDVALQEAKLAYLEQVDDPYFSHPYFWSGFVMMGEASPIYDRGYWRWGLMPLLVLLSWLLYRFIYRRMK